MPYLLKKDEFERVLSERQFTKSRVAFLALDMVPSVFSQVIMGKRLLTLDLAQKLATYMGVPHTYLFTEVPGNVRGRPRIDGIGFVNREVVQKARERLDLFPFKKLAVKFAIEMSAAKLKMILARDRKIEQSLAEKLAAVLNITVEQLISPEDEAYVRENYPVVTLTRDEEIAQRGPNRAPPPVTDPAQLPAFMRQFVQPVEKVESGDAYIHANGEVSISIPNEIAKTHIMDEDEEFALGEEGADDFGPLTESEKAALGIDDEDPNIDP